MKRKRYTVSVELQVMVLAESPESAKAIAINERSFRDALVFRSDSAFTVQESNGTIADGYDADNLVYHDGRGDITVKEALAQSA